MHQRRTRHRFSRWLPGLAALAVIGGAAPAQAQVTIHNNFDAGDTYSPFGWQIGDVKGSNQRVAGTFNTGASSYNALTFEGAFTYGTGTNGLVFRLLGDQGGLPDEGVVLATSSVFSASASGSILTWVLDPSITLSAGTDYWFTAGATVADGATVWNLNTTSDVGVAFNTGSGWTLASRSAPAFRVSGQLVGASAVPEPGEWAAMGTLACGLGGLVVRARRRASR